MQNKRLPLSSLFLLLTLGVLQAQEATITSGGNAAGSGGSSSYTVGLVAHNSNTGTNGSVTEGMQQPFEISTTLGLEVTEINLELKAYPNPTIETLTLSIGSYSNEKLNYQLYDLQGRLLKQQEVTNSITAIDMENLPVSVYMLNVYSKTKLIKTFRIAKN